MMIYRFIACSVLFTLLSVAHAHENFAHLPPNGWKTDYIISGNSSVAEMDLCDGRLKAQYKYFSNLEKTFTVARQVTLVPSASVQIKIWMMYPLFDPMTKKIAHWAPSQYFKDVTFFVHSIGQTKVEVNPEDQMQQGWNLGISCL